LRDPGFLAVHRGGDLSREDHVELMQWAISCFNRVLVYYDKELDETICHAIVVAEGWCKGSYTTGDAIRASRSVHAHAREITCPVAQAVARAVGHGVATAHMADHCMGAALYAQKALKLAGQSDQEERTWQVEQLRHLPEGLGGLVRATLLVKAKGLGL